MSHYKALISSDWSECLSPCGPFDCIAYVHPELSADLAFIFKQYTGNRISLGEAAQRIRKLLPGPITREQMDAYLDQEFRAYQGVPDLIAWCSQNDILFMINTTGMIGYFQRVFAKGLLPEVPVLSAHPMIRFNQQESDPGSIYELFETRDKGKNTEAVVRAFGIAPEKIILIGDSGGDGPHFEWGTGERATLIGSMIKPSLREYCREKDIKIDFCFGVSYARGESRDPQKEMQVDFLDLAAKVEEFLI